MSTTRQSSAERRQQIVEAALHIISTQGVHRLTTLEIAQHVGIADGTIFRHFKNKEEIIDSAVDYLERLLFDDLPDLGEAPLERLKTFFLHRLEQVRKHPAVLRLAFTDRLAEVAGESSAAKLRSLVSRSRQIIVESLTAAQARGEVARDIPLPVLVWTVMGVLRGASLPAPVAPVPQQANVPESQHEGHAADCVPPAPLPGEAVWEGLERLLRCSATGPVANRNGSK